MLFVMGFIFSCQETEPPAPAKLYTEYFPLKTGNYIIYEVDSTGFSSAGDSNYLYELKDLVADTFYDQEKRLNYRIERYHRQASPDAWELREVWVAIPSQQNLITYEQNINYVRLYFPVNVDQMWNQNAYNNLGLMNVNYSEIHKPFKMGTVFVDSTVTVIEKADTTNLVKNEYQKRVYGYNTGLVYYYRDSLQLEFHPQRKGDTIGGYRIKFMIKEHNY
jgi:hypothetical protein